VRDDKSNEKSEVLEVKESLFLNAIFLVSREYQVRPCGKLTGDLPNPNLPSYQRRFLDSPLSRYPRDEHASLFFPRNYIALSWLCDTPKGTQKTSPKITLAELQP